MDNGGKDCKQKEYCDCEEKNEEKGEKDVSFTNDLSKSLEEERAHAKCNIKLEKNEWCTGEEKEEEKGASGKTDLPTCNIAHDGDQSNSQPVNLT